MFSEKSTHISTQQLLEKLQQNRLISSDTVPQIEQLSTTFTKIPIYLQVLVGLGSFFFSLFFIGFLFAIGLIEQEKSLLFWGLIFIGAAIFIHQSVQTQDENNLIFNFLSQTSFSFMAAGKIAFVIGCFIFFEEFVVDIQWLITGAILFITILIYPIYPVAFDRTLSSFSSLMAIFASILISYDNDVAWQNIWLEAFFLLQIIVAAILCTHKKVTKALEPLNYATISAIYTQVILWTVIPEGGRLLQYFEIDFNVIKMILTFALILLIVWIAGNTNKLWQEPFIVALLGVIALGIVSSTGIVLSILLLILGYAKFDRLITASGILLLPVFLFFYYYDLELTLMNKSAILIASGIILLMGYFYLKFRQWHQIGE